MSNLLSPAVAPGDSKGVTILGRTPSAWAALIQSVLAVLVMVGLLDWTGIDTPEEVGLLMAVVSGLLALYVAYATRHTTVSLITGLLNSCVALAAVWGLHLSEDKVATLTLLAATAFGFLNHSLNSPLADVVRGQVVPPTPGGGHTFVSGGFFGGPASSGGISGAIDVSRGTMIGGVPGMDVTASAQHLRPPGG